MKIQFVFTFCLTGSQTIKLLCIPIQKFIRRIKCHNPFIRNGLIDQPGIKERKSNFFTNWFLYVCSQIVLNRPSCRKLILPLMLIICQRTLTIKSFRDLFSFLKTSLSNTLNINTLADLLTLGIILKKLRNNLLNY